MIKQFINLEWKSFFRSAAFKQNLAFKIFIGFFAILFLIEFAALGGFSYLILEEFIEEGKEIDDDLYDDDLDPEDYEDLDFNENWN